MRPKLNVRHPRLQADKSGVNMELDIYVEDHLLAFEYQGQQHYGEYGTLSGPPSGTLDEEKMRSKQFEIFF